jgi:hypothetical protein
MTQSNKNSILAKASPKYRQPRNNNRIPPPGDLCLIGYSQHTNESTEAALRQALQNGFPPVHAHVTPSLRLQLLLLLMKRSDDRGLEEAARLIENGAQVNGTNMPMTTRTYTAYIPLHMAAIHGNVKNVKLLLDNGAQIDHPDRYGYTALFHAAYMGHNEVVGLLLDRGANARARDRRGNSVLSWVIRKLKDVASIVRVMTLLPSSNRPPLSRLKLIVQQLLAKDGWTYPRGGTPSALEEKSDLLRIFQNDEEMIEFILLNYLEFILRYN